MRLWIFCVILVFGHNTNGASRSVTNEDIRDAILSIVNVIRTTEDKLERHEFRERTLGDQIKKVLATIDKRQRLLDPVKGTIARLDERLATVETILLQKDERERIQMQKVFDMVEQIHRSLPQLFETLKNDITTSLQNPEDNAQESTNVEMEKLHKRIATKIDDTSTTVKSIEGQLSKIREENKNNFSSNQKFLEQYNNKLKEYNEQIDILPTKCKHENEIQTNVILKALETQSLDIQKLQTEISGSNATIRKIQEKITQIHDNIEHGHKLNDNINQNLKKLINDSHGIHKNYDSRLVEHSGKIDSISAIYQNKTDLQTKEIMKVLETHNTHMKDIQQEITKLRNSTNTLSDQNTRIDKNVLSSIEKLNLFPKLITNDDLILSDSKSTQQTLNKQTGELKNAISSANNLLKKIETTEDDIKKQLIRLEGNFKNTIEQHFGQCKKSVEGIPEKQKVYNDKIIQVLETHNTNLKDIQQGIVKLKSSTNTLSEQNDKIDKNVLLSIEKLNVLPKLIQNDDLILTETRNTQLTLNKQITNISELRNAVINASDPLKSIETMEAIRTQIAKLEDKLKNTIEQRFAESKKSIEEIPKSQKVYNDKITEAFERHSTSLKDIQQGIAKLKNSANTLSDQNTRIDKNVLSSIDKLSVLPKLIKNDDLILSESKDMQHTLNNQINNESEFSKSLKTATDLLKKLATTDDINDKLAKFENNLKNVMEQRFGESQKGIEGIPEKQKVYNDKIIDALGTHNSNLKDIQQGIIKLKSISNTLSDQNTKIENVLSSFDKLNILPKLIKNDELILRESMSTHQTLNKQINDTIELKNAIKRGNDVLKIIEVAEDDINKKLVKLENSLKNTVDQRFGECKKTIEGIPEKQKVFSDKIIQFLETHNTNLKDIHQVIVKLKNSTNTLSNQNDKIGKNVLLSIEKLHALPKLIQNDDLILTETKNTQLTLDKQITNISELRNAIINSNDNIVGVLETHNTTLEDIQKGIVKLENMANTLSDQSARINKNILLSIDKLNPLPKLITNDDLILSESRNAQQALNKQMNNVNEVKNSIKTASDLLKKLETTDDDINHRLVKLEDNLRNMASSFGESKKSIDGIPEKQKVYNDKIVEALQTHNTNLKNIQQGIESLKGISNTLSDQTSKIDKNILSSFDKLNILPKLIKEDERILSESRNTQLILNNTMELKNTFKSTNDVLKKIKTTEDDVIKKLIKLEDNLKNTIEQGFGESKKSMEGIPEKQKVYNGKIVEVLESHNTDLKHIQQGIVQIKNISKILTDQNANIDRNVLSSIEKLNILPKLIENGNIILSESKDTQQTLNTQLNNVSELKDSISAVTDLLKELERTDGDINQKLVKLEDNLKNTMVQRFDECKKTIEGIPERQKVYNDKVLQALNLQSNTSNSVKDKIENIVERILKIQESCNQTVILRKALEGQIKHVKKLERHIENNTLLTSNTLQTMETHLEKIHENTKQHSDTSEFIKRNLSSNSALLQKYDEKLAKYHDECKERNDIQSFLKVLENCTSNANEMNKYTNEQLRKIEDENNIILEFNKEQFANITKLLNKTANQECSKEFGEIRNVTISIRDRLENKTDNSQLLESMKLIEELTENLNGNIAISFGKLINQIENLQKLEDVVAQASDNIIDTKRRVEYGVHQVTTDISNVIKSQTKDLSSVFNSRFNNLELSILDNDEGLLANLTIRMAKEVDQVWKQIGMMHQQMSLTNEILTKLQNQADLFGIGTVNNMDNMKGKVGKITSRVAEVDSNLNVLLGQLSLISQKFNQTKIGLIKALDEINRNFQTVQNQIKPTGTAGPYPINRI